jgi:hypothetical protein
MCRSIPSISPSSSNWRPIVGESTSRFFPPAAAQPDPSRLGWATVQERDSGGGCRVVEVVGEHEDMSIPGTDIHAAGIREGVPTVSTAQYRAGRRDVLLDQIRTERNTDSQSIS